MGRTTTRIDGKAPPAERRLQRLAAAAEAELRRDIIPFWLRLRDSGRGGFFGGASARGRPLPSAAKTAVLQTRVLWFFSAAHRRLGDPTLLSAATAAYEFIASRMVDPVDGGVFWAVSPEGAPADTRKHLYAQAFAVMALAAYHRASTDADALALAEALWRLLADRATRQGGRGYLEAFSRDWTPTNNELVGRAEAVRTFNTHLHLLESCAELLGERPRGDLRDAVEALVRLLIEAAFDRRRRSFRQFFDADWRPLDGARSFGHDIEASWLVPRCAAQVSPQLAAEARTALAGVAERVLKQAQDGEGGVIAGDDGFRPTDRGRIWWVQAEALVGFLDAYEHAGDARFLAAAERLWRFIERRVIDGESGEWRWRVEPQGAAGSALPKAHGWKGPYHNGRACLELIDLAAGLARARRSPLGDSAGAPPQDRLLKEAD